MRVSWCIPVLFCCLVMSARLSTPMYAAAPAAKVIFDTDIGDDIDDAYALALLLKSPEIGLVGVTTAFGDTQLRARLVTRLLKETGNTGIPVYAGPKTPPKTQFTQREWAEGSPEKTYPDAIAFMIDTIRKNPGQVTLISVAPFTNVGALIKKDPALFKKLKRVVIMGGSVNRGYGASGPDAEWNVQCDIPAAQALFNSGVPLYVMPLDSTMVPLELVQRDAIAHHGTPTAKALTELTEEWANATQKDTPTLFDMVAASYAIRPELCPMTPMRLGVDDKGFTRKMDGAPNAHACLKSDPEAIFSFVMPRLLR